MTPVPSQRPLRSGPCLWGPLRVRAGLSLRDLEAESGIPRGILSRVERVTADLPERAAFDEAARAAGQAELALTAAWCALCPEEREAIRTERGR